MVGQKTMIKLIIFKKTIVDKTNIVWKKNTSYPIVSANDSRIFCETEKIGETNAVCIEDMDIVFSVDWCSGAKGTLKKCLTCVGCKRLEEMEELYVKTIKDEAHE
jgi:hypothetical protein